MAEHCGPVFAVLTLKPPSCTWPTYQDEDIRLPTGQLCKHNSGFLPTCHKRKGIETPVMCLGHAGSPFVRLLLPISRESMRSPPWAPKSSSTGEFADLDGVGVALQAKAAQALPGILVGQVEAPLQVLGGRLLHVQLLGVLLVKEANFLPKRRGR